MSWDLLKNSLSRSPSHLRLYDEWWKHLYSPKTVRPFGYKDNNDLCPPGQSIFKRGDGDY